MKVNQSASQPVSRSRMLGLSTEVITEGELVVIKRFEC